MRGVRVLMGGTLRFQYVAESVADESPAGQIQGLQCAVCLAAFHSFDRYAPTACHGLSINKDFPFLDRAVIW